MAKKIKRVVLGEGYGYCEDGMNYHIQLEHGIKGGLCKELKMDSVIGKKIRLVAELLDK